jgi:hypothetical protein
MSKRRQLNQNDSFEARTRIVHLRSRKNFLAEDALQQAGYHGRMDQAELCRQNKSRRNEY